MVQVQAANTTKEAHTFSAEKEEVIKWPKSLAMTTGTAFSSLIPACLDIIYDQLIRLQSVIRKASMTLIIYFLIFIYFSVEKTM